MADERNPNAYLFKRPVRGIWLHVIKPRPLRPNDPVARKPRFEASFMIPVDDTEDLPAIKALLGRAAMEKFGTTTGIKFPLQDGNKVADAAKLKNRDREFLRGQVLLAAHANTVSAKGDTLNPPRLSVLVQNAMSGKGEYVDYEGEHRQIADKFFYPGVLLRADITVATYPAPLGPGVHAYVNHLLSFNSGEKLAIGMDNDARWGDADETFKQYVGHVSAADPTAGMNPAEIKF